MSETLMGEIMCICGRRHEVADGQRKGCKCGCIVFFTATETEFTPHVVRPGSTPAIHNLPEARRAWWKREDEE